MAPRQSVAERGNAQRNRGLEGFYAAAGNSLVDLFLFLILPKNLYSFFGRSGRQ